MAPLLGHKRSFNDSNSEFDTHEPDIAIENCNIPNIQQEASHRNFISRLGHKLTTPFSFRKRPYLNIFPGDLAQSREAASTSSPTLHNASPKANVNEEHFSALSALPRAVQLDQDVHTSLSSLIEATYPEHDLQTPRKDMEEITTSGPESDNVSNDGENISATTKKQYGYAWKISV